jgi:N-acetylglucosaminyl-diphospho-decaprenol L-rhamnosyltransferase
VPPGGAAPEVGVVVVSHNTRALLDECLTALRSEADGPGPTLEVVVVDSASTDDSPEMVRARHGWARLVASPDNVGYSAAANRALRAWLAASDGPPWLVVMNADARPLPGALARLRDALAERPKAGVAGPGLEYPDGRFQQAAFADPGVVQTWLDLFPVARLADSHWNGRYPRRAYRAGVPFPVDFPLGACFMVNAAAVHEVGVLDETYFMYCEEIDWCRRFRRAGYSVWCVPAARVVHHAGASTSQVRPEMFVALWRSRLRLFDTFESPARRRLLHAVVRWGLAAQVTGAGWRERRGAVPAGTRAALAAARGRILAPVA